ncbi:MAG: 4-(cytidine 5'-diphospho)-2-C-methyl-D-erythritol kinase, partial [Candidatus Binatia bacterium]
MSTPSSAREVRLLAPAKINLVLEVVGRRPDGYHDIDSVFVPIDLCDEVRLSIAPHASFEIHLECDDPSLPSDRRNTAWRAVEEFFRNRARRPRVAVSLRKRIPAGSGLGGGSSDAAAVLRALARVEGVPERAPEVMEAALAVGADVPFFLWCRPARVRGIGERIEPLGSFPELSLAIVWPGFPISTRSAYEALDRSLTSRKSADTM